MSLEAARGLLQLGVKGVEVETMMRSSLTSTTNISWSVLLNLWHKNWK